MKTASIVFLILMLWNGVSSGEMYKYTDDQGIVCFTAELKEIPPKYRKKATIIKEDDGKVSVAPPAQADKIDESLLPPKEEAAFKSEADDVPGAKEIDQQQAFPYKNAGIIFSVFLATFIPGFFIKERNVKRIFGAASVAAMLTLLLYLSSFFAAGHMQALKKDALEMTEMMKKKDSAKEKAIQEMFEEPAKQK